MKSFWLIAWLVCGLSACASNGSGSHNEIYGTITGGVESTKYF